MDFPHEVRFSAGIGPAHFLAVTTRPLRPRLSAFSPNFEVLSCRVIFVKMAGDGGPNALSLLPENVLPQWQQKIASQKIIARPFFSLFIANYLKKLLKYYVFTTFRVRLRSGRWCC